MRREPAVRGVARASHCGIAPCDSGPHTKCLGSSARDTATTNSYQHEYFRGIGRMMTRPGRWCPRRSHQSCCRPTGHQHGCCTAIWARCPGPIKSQCPVPERLAPVAPRLFSAQSQYKISHDRRVGKLGDSLPFPLSQTLSSISSNFPPCPQFISPVPHCLFPSLQSRLLFKPTT